MRKGPGRFPLALLGALLLIGSAPGASRAEEPAPERPWAVVGRVVDDLRRPVANAQVALCAGADEVRGRSDAHGDFRLAYDAPPLDLAYATVRARSGDLVASTQLWVDSYAHPLADAGAIVLHPGTTLRVLVEGLLGPAPGAWVYASVVPADGFVSFWERQDLSLDGMGLSSARRRDRSRDVRAHPPGTRATPRDGGRASPRRDDASDPGLGVHRAHGPPGGAGRDG